MSRAAFDGLEGVYRHWLKVEDTYPLRAAVGAYAANLLPGEPVWLVLVGGSGSGKTETLNVLSGLPKVRAVSTLSGEAALLSGTSRRERSKDATGGLLGEIGTHGVLVLKDFTSILSKHRDTRAAILGALRECFDGSWTRDVGAEGGRHLSWAGKLGLLAGCTTALDHAHSVMSLMGERFLLARMPTANVAVTGRAAMDNVGRERQMRAEMSAATNLLFAGGLPADAEPLSETRVDRLIEAASVVALARSPIERDHNGSIDLVLDAEAPTRLVKALAQLNTGLETVGLTPDESWEVIARVALDSVPKLRRLCLTTLTANVGEMLTTTDVAVAVEHPTTSTRRALEDLVAHGVARREAGGEGHADKWRVRSNVARTVEDLMSASYPQPRQISQQSPSRSLTTPNPH